jgi:chromosomal replication initiator protein
MLSYLRRHHGELCRQWFEELEPLRLEGGVLEVRVNNGVQKNYLAHRCNGAFNEAAQAVTGALVAVSFVNGVPPTSNGEGATAGAGQREAAGAAEPSRSGGAASATEAAEPAAPRRPSSGNGASRYDDDQILLSPDYTFDNFVTGPGNRLAYAAAVAVGEQPGRAYNPLFIHGGVGLGKTHLLQAVCQTILRANPDTNICYLSCDSFMNQFLESVQNGRMNEFRNRYRHVDLMLIDDIHFLSNRERTQEEFFHTFNTLFQAEKQLVLSSDSPPDEIPALEERLVSRFNWGLVARIDKPCYETRVAIVRKKAEIRGVEIPDDAVCHIAAKLDSNIRELEGAITKVQSMAMLRQKPIDLELTRQAFGEDEPASTGPQLTIQNIIDAVTQYYGVKLSDLQSKRRHRSITVPRQVCMYLARKRTRYSLEEIGGYFGGRDHTTVLHAIRTTEDRMSIESDFAEQVDQIDRQLTAG